MSDFDSDSFIYYRGAIACHFLKKRQAIDGRRVYYRVIALSLYRRKAILRRSGRSPLTEGDSLENRLIAI